MKILFVLLLALSAACFADDGVLRPFTAEYTVYSRGFKVAEAKLQLMQQNDYKWHYQATANVAGMPAVFRDDALIASSTFLWVEQRIIPLEYRWNHTGNRDGKRFTTSFNWGSQQARVSGLTPDLTEIALLANTFCPLSILLALSTDLALQRLLIDYPVLLNTEYKHLQLQIRGKDTVRIAATDYTVTKLAYEEDSRITWSWHAQELGFLPVQIAQYKKDKLRIVFTLTAFHWN